MIPVVVITTDPDLQTQLANVFGGIGNVDLVRSVHQYTSIAELSRTIRICAPRLIFCSSSISPAVAFCAGNIPSNPGVIAVGSPVNDEELSILMEAGVKEFLATPIQRKLVRAVLDRAKRSVRPPLERPYLSQVEQDLGFGVPQFIHA
ncbi:MAG: hypothetical protein H7Y20_09585 [Bryobacteraceae bacterium]|nr:hypothetical protein [Bryobacteraceae bacterium]